MTRTWQPGMADGWFPRLTVIGDRIFITWGNTNCWLAELRLTDQGFQEVRRARLNDGARAYGGWWIADDQLTFYQEVPGTLTARRFVVDVRAAAWTPRDSGDDPALVAGNDFAAAGGHWGSWLASSPARLVRDGQVVATHVGTMQMAGDRMAAADSYPDWPTGIATWKGGRPAAVLPCLIPMTTLGLGADGHIVYGGNGDLFAIDPSGIQQRCLATPWRYEGPGPIRRHPDGTTWLATITFDPSIPDGQAPNGWVLLRPWPDGGTPGQAVLQVEAAAIHADILPFADQWLVATSGELGQLLLQAVPQATTRQVLTPRVRTMAPKWLGYFYAAGRYGDFEPVQNCTVLSLANFADGAGTIPADAVARLRAAATQAGAIFIGPDPRDIDALRDRWDLVAGIVLGELDTAAISQAADAARALVAARGLPARLVYATLKADQMFRPDWSVPAGIDVLAPEVYFDAPAGSWNDMVAAVHRRIDQTLDAAGGVPVQLIPQAYDRDRPAWKTADGLDALEAIQSACLMALAADVRLTGCWWFAFARPGGARAYRVLQDWHAAAVRASARPAITSPARAIPPTVTIPAFLPTSGQAPLTVLATSAFTGQVDTLHWRYRKLGATEWITQTVKLATDTTPARYIFSDPGIYEISLQGRGPSGTAETGLRRIVTVTAPQPPPPPTRKDPTMDPVTVQLQTYDGVHYVRAEDGGGPEGHRVGIGGTRTRPAGLVNAAGPDPSAWQTFTAVPGNQPGTFGFRSSGGFWMSAQADGAVLCNRQRPDDWVPESWEAFLVTDMGDGRIALQTAHGTWVCAEQGGGGVLVANRHDPGIWESFTPSVVFWRPAATVAPKRTGIVTAHGRLPVDDQGPFHPLGITFFWAVWGVANDMDRTKGNMAAVADAGIDFVRYLGEVGGTSWEDRTIDPRDPSYEQHLADAIDLAADYGLRVVLSIFGGGTGAPIDLTVDKVLRVVHGREAAILAIEPANEDNFPGSHDDLRRVLRKIRDAFPGIIVNHSPDDGDLTKTAADLDICNALNLHTDRTVGDDGWRVVRQTWGISYPCPLFALEPPGLHLGQNADVQDLRRLAALRAVGIQNGFTTFVLHVGPGVRGGGVFDGRYGRAANFYDLPDLKDAVAALRAVDSVLPVDVCDYRKTSQHGHDPFADNFLFADAIWSDGDDHGVSRNFLAYRGGDFIALTFGVKHYTDLHAKRTVHFTVYDMLTGQAVGDPVTIQANSSWRLQGDPNGTSAAFVLRGTVE